MLEVRVGEGVIHKHPDCIGAVTLTPEILLADADAEFSPA